MTTALIADDERLMREQLRARLAEVWPELQIVAEARNGLEAVTLTEEHHPDIVFLDIRMPGLTGVDAARQIAQLPTHDEVADHWPGCEVVFITAYDQYAVEAFEQGVVDYVLKPAERERLQLTVSAHSPAHGSPRGTGRARYAVRRCTAAARPHARHAAAAAEARRPAQSGGPAQAAVDPGERWGQSIQMIPVEEVLFFISDEKYTRVQTATTEALIRKPIKELLEELDMALFWQIHRSTLVNTRAIAGVTRDMRGRQLVSVKGHPEKLEVSRSFTGLFKGM